MKETCHIHQKKYFLCDIRLLKGYGFKAEIVTLPKGDRRMYPKMHTIRTLTLTLSLHIHVDAQRYLAV